MVGADLVWEKNTTGWLADKPANNMMLLIPQSMNAKAHIGVVIDHGANVLFTILVGS